jgi:two-component system LytT family sensor kinase
MPLSLNSKWLQNRYTGIAGHLIFCLLYWYYVMSDFEMTMGRTGDKVWNNILFNSFFAVIILSIYALIYALRRSLPSRFYIFALVSVVIYFFNAYFIYYAFQFFAAKPNASQFVTFGYQRMKTGAFWMIPFNRFVDLYIWALTGNYIVIPLAIIGINNTFSYFNRNLKLQKDNLSLELDFLKSQINPHFLFNSLNNIYSMVEETNEVAANAILKLANLMRYSLYESNSENVNLSREILFLKDYIELEKMRHSSDTNIVFEFKGDFETHSIPPFILIPFVENAFKHGLDTIEKNWIKIFIQVIDSKLILEVSNSKPRAKLKDQQKGGIGLVNLRKRLDIYYPNNQYELKSTNNVSEYHVYLRIDLK